MLTSEDVANLLLDAGAFSVNVQRPFVDEGGRLAPAYTDGRLIASFPKERALLVAGLAELASGIGATPDVVLGVGVAGPFLGSLVAQAWERPMAYARAAAKGHGTGKHIEGIIAPGARVLLVVDVVATEGTLTAAIDAVRQAGARPEAVVALSVDRAQAKEGDAIRGAIVLLSNGTRASHRLAPTEEGASRPAMRDVVPAATLTNAGVLADMALKRGVVGEAEREVVRAWLADPEHWQPPAIPTVTEVFAAAKDRVGDALATIGAVRFETITFKSGMLSPMYVDARLLIAHPPEWEVVLEQFAAAIAERAGSGKVDCIAGTATAAVPHAARIADRLGLPHVSVRSSPEEFGKRSRLDGRVPARGRTVVVEDLVTTGGSAVATAQVLRDAGATVEWCFAIATYQFPESRAAFQQAGISLVALTDVPSILGAAKRAGRVSPAKVAEVEFWMNDPWGWGKRSG